MSLFISLTQKNRKRSRLDSFTEGLSPIRAALYEWNLIKISIKLGSKLGTVSRNGFKVNPSLAD